MYSTYEPAAAWILLTIMLLAIVCALIGSPLAGIVIMMVTVIVIIFVLLPPVYDTAPNCGTGKWVYSKDGAVRYDPNLLKHGEAQVPNSTPRSQIKTVGENTIEKPTETNTKKNRSKKKSMSSKSASRSKSGEASKRFATSHAQRPPLPPPGPGRRDYYVRDIDPQDSGALLEGGYMPRPYAADIPGNAYPTGILGSNVPAIPPKPIQQCSADTPLCAQQAQALWRIPQYPVQQPSREGTIADVVPDLPDCAQMTPKQIIRNQGLYGIKGDLRCDLLQRSTYQDTRFVEPISARNQFLGYLAYDQLHAKDQYMVASDVSPAILQRNPPPLPQQRYSSGQS